MALLCSRCLDLLDHRDHQDQLEHQDLQELMENLAIQERTGKLVLLGHMVPQEIQELLVPKAKRVKLDLVNQDLEVPLVHQDFLDLAPATAQSPRSSWPSWDFSCSRTEWSSSLRTPWSTMDLMEPLVYRALLVLLVDRVNQDSLE
ncbi:hypothetical protein E3U43_019136 [Larimichthys crocea]|uniref:Uncharacterized protein n=1 Tax=Larimichthys crocea TaxID=215358 RepID=A0ACD3QX71_LARCR|nr:hypothetical protein E3U43_019136 [Larimichthys crocea]